MRSSESAEFKVRKLDLGSYDLGACRLPCLKSKSKSSSNQAQIKFKSSTLKNPYTRCKKQDISHYDWKKVSQITASRNHLTPPPVPQLLLGPISTYLLLKISQSFYYDLKLATCMTIILLILSGPLLFAISLALNDLNNWRAARAIGAVLPPRVLDYSPGNIYSIWKGIQNRKKGYFGEISFFLFLLDFPLNPTHSHMCSFR